MLSCPGKGGALVTPCRETRITVHHVSAGHGRGSACWVTCPASEGGPLLSSDCPECPPEIGVQTFVPTNLSEWIGVKNGPSDIDERESG
jgi:hypothetical protein